MEGRVDVRLGILSAVDLELQVVEHLLGCHLLKLLGCNDMTRSTGAAKDEGHALDMWQGILHGFLSFWLLLLIMIIQMMMMRLARSSFD